MSKTRKEWEGWQRVSIVGTGLIGGSFALAARPLLGGARLVGWDLPEVLERALARGVVDEADPDLSGALRDADLIYIALPIARALDRLPTIARLAPPRALVTDACSTKEAICRAAAQQFRTGARFLGGHPLAGRELSGIENAEGKLFCGAMYALTASADDADKRVQDFGALVQAMGAEPVWLDPVKHDWAVAVVSHLPQLAAVALARVLNDETDETGLPLLLAGTGARDALRLAGSPYEVWRDIALTNRENLSRALDQLAQAVEHLRLLLAARELRDEFETANHIYQILRGVK